MIAHRVEGIVIAPVSDRSKSHLRRLAKFGVPFVLIDRTVSGHRVRRRPRRQLRRRRSARRAPDLARPPPDRLHRRVRRGVDRSRPPARLRVRAGRCRDPARPGARRRRNRRPAGGHEGMRRLLELDDPPTAVFTVNNLVALGAIEAVRAAGLEVPDDVALVCFDDIEYASRLYPFLTVMEQPAEAFGTLGTQLLLDRIAGRGAQRPARGRPSRRVRHAEVVRRLDGARTAHDRLRRDRGRGLEVGMRGRDRARRPPRGGDGSDDDPRGDDRPRRRLLRTRGAGRRDRASARSARSTGSRRRRPGVTSRRRRSRAGHTPTSARRSAGGSRCRSPSTPTSTRPRWASTAGVRPRGSTRSATSRSAPGSAAAAMVGGKLLHGLVHPEFGHMRIPHDRDADPFPGVCPYHGDCWEGLASGRAIEARWGRPALRARRRRRSGSSRPGTSRSASSASSPCSRRSAS